MLSKKGFYYYCKWHLWVKFSPPDIPLYSCWSKPVQKESDNFKSHFISDECKGAESMEAGHSSLNDDNIICDLPLRLKYLYILTEYRWFWSCGFSSWIFLSQCGNKWGYYWKHMKNCPLRVIMHGTYILLNTIREISTNRI